MKQLATGCNIALLCCWNSCSQQCNSKITTMFSLRSVSRFIPASVTISVSAPATAPTTPDAPLPFIHIYPTLPVLAGRRPTFCSAIWKFKRFVQHEHMLNVDFSFAVPSKRSRPPTRPQPSAWQTTTQTATTTATTPSTWPGTRRTSTTSVTGGETRKMAKRANQMKPFIVCKHFWGKRQMSKSKWSQNTEQQSMRQYEGEWGSVGAMKHQIWYTNGTCIDIFLLPFWPTLTTPNWIYSAAWQQCWRQWSDCRPEEWAERAGAGWSCVG